MEFPVETADGKFAGIVVDSMDHNVPEEMQYICDDNEMITEVQEDFSNITDLILEDGTRAMIVNGTLVTADGQTLILQDGSDLSQYSLEDNNELILGTEHENQFLQVMTENDAQTDEQSFIQYIEDDSNDMNIKGIGQQVLYIQDGDNLLPMQEPYQIAEVNNSESCKEPIQVIKLEDNKILHENGGVIDLEQLLLSQPNGLKLQGNNYQYAIFKDGKFHLQVANDAFTVLDENQPSNGDDYIDCSAIKGRNVKTGQVISLSTKPEKVDSKKSKHHFGKYLVNPDGLNKYSCAQSEPKKVNKGLAANLKKLINKKIPIGPTDKGKMLVGKIVKVMKRSDLNSSKKDEAGGSQRVQVYKSPKARDVSKLPVREIINLVDDYEDNPCVQSQKTTSANIRFISQEAQLSTEPISTPINTVIKPGSPKKTLPVISKKYATNKINHTNDIISINDVNTNGGDFSKIIVQKKVVSKECFEIISRTIIGLMNLDSVVGKLKNKTIIVKIIEKIYNHDTCSYTKSVSYCSGYMVREFKLENDDSSFSDNWKFIPETNSKGTIFGIQNTEGGIQNTDSSQQNSKRITNLSIQITINPEGCRSTKVIINPRDFFQCKYCSKIFRTSTLLKLHSLNCIIASRNSEPQEQAQSVPVSSSKNNNSLPITQTVSMELSIGGTKKVVEKKVCCCHICGRQFSRYSNLQRHVEIHQGDGAKYRCSICSCSYHYVSSLTRHMLSCHVNKSKTPLNNLPTAVVDQTTLSDDQLQYLQDGQMIQMIPLEQMTDESLQQYVTEYVEQDYEEGGVQVLQVPTAHQ